jgi:CRP-like cAMP-binding protein
MSSESWEVALLGIITSACVFEPIRISTLDAPHCKPGNLFEIFALVGDILWCIELLRITGCFPQPIRIAPTQTEANHQETKEHSQLPPPSWKSLEFLLGVISIVPMLSDTVHLLARWEERCNGTGIVTSLGTLRILRIFAVSRLSTSLKFRLKDRKLEISPYTSRLMIILYFTLLGVSASGCAYLFIACPPGRREHCRRGWEGEDVEINTWALQDEQMTSDWQVQYVRATYFSMQTILTIGYGDDVGPVSRSEVIMTCLLMLIGRCAYSATTAAMSSLVANSNVNTMRYKQEMDTLNSYMDTHSIPSGLQGRVKDYFEYLYKRQLGVVDTKLLMSPAEVPHAIEVPLIEHRAEMLKKVPFFAAQSATFVTAAARLLEVRTYTPNSTILFFGERQRELVIVTSGSVGILAPSRNDASKLEVASSLNTGDFIGDQDLLLGSFNMFAVKTGENCYAETLVLAYPQFQSLLARFENVQINEYEESVLNTVSEHHKLVKYVLNARYRRKTQMKGKGSKKGAQDKQVS